MCVCVCVFIAPHIHMCMHTHTHTHTHQVLVTVVIGGGVFCFVLFCFEWGKLCRAMNIACTIPLLIIVLLSEVRVIGTLHLHNMSSYGILLYNYTLNFIFMYISKQKKSI